MPLRDDLLNPVAGDNPAGADLRYDPLYDKIKEARREEEDVPQGDWQRARKLADWPQVIKLAGDALATKTKDLQLAAWLAEAVLRKEGYGSFRATLDVLRGMLEQFWEQLYPEIEDDDLEMRAAPLEWLGSRLDLALRSVPLDRAGHTFLQYKEARAFGTEEEASADDGKAARRAEAIEEGKPTPEDIDKSLAETPKPFYKQLAADIDATIASVASLDEVAKEKFGSDAPSFLRLRESLEDVQRTARQLLARKLELDPDPPEAVAAPAEVGGDMGAAGAGAAPAAGAPGGVLAAEPVDRNDAAQRVIGAARFLRRTEPRNPASYLMLRALRWGELRAEGSSPDPKLLEAPTTHVRTQLRGLMLDSSWDQLLELAETVMGTPVGRGWLDLQRYTLTALQSMGEDYAAVASSIRAEIRSLLAAVPSLPTMTLMDDMPTANGATLEWLREAGLVGGEAEAADEAVPMPVPAPDGGDRSSRAAMDRATAEVRAGRPDKAIEMLMRALEREKSRRGRFLRQAQLAQVMVEAGLLAVARPILEELMNDIESHKLEEWEAGQVVAQPMALLYKVLERTEDDSGTKETLYLRICRLDPLQAIGFAQA